MNRFQPSRMLARAHASGSKPDAGLALTTQQTIVGLRNGCKCAKPYRGCIQCIAAELIERMDRIIKRTTAGKAKSEEASR